VAEGAVTSQVVVLFPFPYIVRVAIVSWGADPHWPKGHVSVATPVTMLPSGFEAMAVMAVVPTFRSVASPAGAPSPPGLGPGPPVLLIVATVTLLELQVTVFVKSCAYGAEE
jgi:hypothetical protein